MVTWKIKNKININILPDLLNVHDQCKWFNLFLHPYYILHAQNLYEPLHLKLQNKLCPYHYYFVVLGINSEPLTCRLKLYFWLISLTNTILNNFHNIVLITQHISLYDTSRDIINLTVTLFHIYIIFDNDQ